MASRKPKFKHYSIMVPQGGKLISGSNSQDTAGSGNYVEKINFRRETDGEVRREGWSRFVLSEVDEPEVLGVDVLPNQNTSDENLPIRLLTQFSSNGNLILIAGAGSSIYALGEDAKDWKLIATGLNTLDNGVAKHWESVVIDGYLFLNNGHDLPLIYRDGWFCAFPMFSLRERGIVRVGTISEFDGRLFLGDITYIDESVDGAFLQQMQSDDPYSARINVPTISVPHIIEYSSWRLTDQSTEAKAAPYLFGQNYNATVSELNGTQITKLEIPYFLGGVRESSNSQDDKRTFLNPYYTFSYEEYSQYDFRNSTIVVGDKIRFSVTDSAQTTNVYDAEVVSIVGNQDENKTTITLKDAYNNTAEGVVTYTGGEQSGLTQTLAVGDSAVIVLLKEPDIFNPDANIAREASDALSFPEDGSRILKMVRLGDKLVVHRETGYLLISKGDKLSAFYFEDRYKGERVADMRNTVININDQRQMFVGYNGVFTITPASVEPEPMMPMMMGPEFWRLITNSEIEYVYSIENSITQEIFITCPIGYNFDRGYSELDWGVIAYDLLQGTVSQIDYAFTAMTNTFATRRMPSKRFLMGSHLTLETTNEDGTIDYYFPNITYGDVKFKDTETITEAERNNTEIGARIMRYGYGASEELRGPFRQFSRDGADYKCTLKFGKSDFGDRFSEKKVRSYALHMSDVFQYKIYVDGGYMDVDYTDSAVVAEAKVTSFTTAQVDPQEEVVETLEDLSNEVMVPMYAQGNYFQDTLTLTGIDKPFKVIGRTFEVSGVRTKLTNEVSDA